MCVIQPALKTRVVIYFTSAKLLLQSKYLKNFYFSYK